jgi:RNA polymerase sigma factor (sigma-70 family)
MVNGCTNTAYCQVARVFRDGTLSGMSDREVLERYVDRRDEAAFEAIVARHGPMVLNVCRHLLRDPHDVEDAFQAAFLALIRKAGSIRVESSLGPWLHTIASRIAVRARANRLRRGARERSREPLPEHSTIDRLDCFEIPRVVQEELGRLPERLRAPIILCYLEGITHDMAARQLRCPVGTVSSRLARARASLHRRMVRRGLTISAGTLAAMLESSSKAATVPPDFQRSLIVVATRFVSEAAAGSLASGVGGSASVGVLLEGVLKVMRIKRLLFNVAALAAVGFLVAVVGATAFSTSGQPDDHVAAKTESRPEQSPPKSAPQTIIKTYYIGDLLTVNTSPSTKGSSQPTVDMRPVRIDL